MERITFMDENEDVMKKENEEKEENKEEEKKEPDWRDIRFQSIIELGILADALKRIKKGRTECWKSLKR